MVDQLLSCLGQHTGLQSMCILRKWQVFPSAMIIAIFSDTSLLLIMFLWSILCNDLYTDTATEDKKCIDITFESSTCHNDGLLELFVHTLVIQARILHHL